MKSDSVAAVNDPEFVKEIERRRVYARGRIHTRRVIRSGPHPDSIAAEHQEIFELEQEWAIEDYDGIGWGGGEY